MSSYDQMQQTVYAIAIARLHVEEQFHQCVRGWGDQETYHSDQIKLKGEKLLELQMHWQEKLDELDRESVRRILDNAG